MIPTPANVMLKRHATKETISEREGKRMWSWMLHGLKTCTSFVEGYVALSMPACPIDELRSIRDRLNTMLEKVENA